MSPRRPWKLYVLAIFAMALAAAVWFTKGDAKKETTSQWAMPETAAPVTGSNPTDPFPQLKKVLTPEEIRNGESGAEENPSPATSAAPENANSKK